MIEFVYSSMLIRLGQDEKMLFFAFRLNIKSYNPVWITCQNLSEWAHKSTLHKFSPNLRVLQSSGIKCNRNCPGCLPWRRGGRSSLMGHVCLSDGKRSLIQVSGVWFKERSLSVYEHQWDECCQHTRQHVDSSDGLVSKWPTHTRAEIWQAVDKWKVKAAPRGIYVKYAACSVQSDSFICWHEKPLLTELQLRGCVFVAYICVQNNLFYY